MFSVSIGSFGSGMSMSSSIVGVPAVEICSYSGTSVILSSFVVPKTFLTSGYVTGVIVGMYGLLPFILKSYNVASSSG